MGRRESSINKKLTLLLFLFFFFVGLPNMESLTTQGHWTQETENISDYGYLNQTNPSITLYSSVTVPYAGVISFRSGPKGPPGTPYPLFLEDWGPQDQYEILFDVSKNATWIYFSRTTREDTEDLWVRLILMEGVKEAEFSKTFTIESYGTFDLKSSNPNVTIMKTAGENATFFLRVFVNNSSTSSVVVTTSKTYENFSVLVPPGEYRDTTYKTIMVPPEEPPPRFIYHLRLVNQSGVVNGFLFDFPTKPSEGRSGGSIDVPFDVGIPTLLLCFGLIRIIRRKKRFERR